MKKKILMLGNSEIVIYNFRRELIHTMIEEGYDVYISLPYGEKVEKLKDMGCKFIDTKINRRSTNPIEDINLFIKYYRMIKKIKPDLILSYTMKPNVYGGIASRLNKVPYICSVTGLGSGYINGGIVQNILKCLLKISLKKSEKVYFQNTSDLNRLIDDNIIKNNYIITPGSGVNLDEYKIEPYPEENLNISFNFIARVMKDKGIDEYLYVAQKVKEKYPKAIFNIIGQIDDIQYEKILNEYDNKGIIKYHGFQSNIKSFISSSSCIINPSYAEGMSNVLLEHAALGRPLIASNIPGCKEIIDDGINGYTFEVKNVDDMYKKVIKFIELNHDEKINMGINGRLKIEKEFDRTIVVKEYMNEIRNIIDNLESDEGIEYV